MSDSPKIIKFDVALKSIQQEGTLAWEYNPFRNYRLDEDMVCYKNQFYSIKDFFNIIKNNKLSPPEKIEVQDNTGISDQVKIEHTDISTVDGYYAGGFHEYREGIAVITRGYEGTYKKGVKLINNKYLFTYTYHVGGKEKIYLMESSDWSQLGFPKTEEIPVMYQKGQLVDFITDEFKFDLNHPVQITPQYSYDNSVDLIINDGNTSPKIINSRFSAIGKNKYKIVDRNGNNDTNIYDKGTQFDIDTSLYKVTSLIPEVTFGGEAYGGNLQIGNYHFYFKYSDLDGNESDFVAQSGLVSVFLGNTPNSINTGFRNQNSNKKVRFILSNIDEAYDYIIVYYSRASSEEYQNRVTQYAKILQKYKVSQYNNTIIDITGFEDTQDVAYEDINQRLQIYDSAKTSAISQNMLFLGNVTQSNQNHDTLSRLALYIIPSIDVSKTCDVDKLNGTYQGDTSNTYYNPNFIYNYTGYWDDELYRFGVVFIRNNNTLTPVYNIRGGWLCEKDGNGENSWKESIDEEHMKITSENELVSYDETTFKIDSEFQVFQKHAEYENARGVCYIPQQDNLTKIVGINFKCHKTVISQLEKLGIKGYFIVRQKRIPTTLCQAYTIGLDSTSRTPMLPIKSDEYIYESFLDKETSDYNYWEDGKRKTGNGYLLTHLFDQHKRTPPKSLVKPRAAICPDYDVNSAYLNSLFTGSDFVVTTQHQNDYLSPTNGGRLYEAKDTRCELTAKYTDVKIIGVEDNVKLVGIGDTLFSARAGEAEEAFRFSTVGSEIKKDHGGSNLIRGSFGPYLGITGYNAPASLITIKIPGYNIGNLLDYFKIRYYDATLFYPISNRFTFTGIEDSQEDQQSIINLGTYYRGDCYICKFTHRLNRNFTDASTPTNDTIVDPTCWAQGINYEDEVLKKDDFEKINLGDVNAVNLGMWVTFTLRSGINHSVRSLDQSQVDEAALIGNCRGFYPYHPIAPQSAYKIPEAGTYNKGFEASVGEQVFEELPIVPYYKDVFSTRIAYSNIQITSAFKNAYRVFAANHYRDYPITYGEITKILEWNGDLICVLEHGIYKIPINERAVAGEGSGGLVYINTSNVLPENPLVISDTFGSQWIDSIIKTPSGIYGVDTVAKKIWKVDNSGIELISDFKVQEFLNNNITLTERELTPFIGIRNVKTHYNAFKKDVMFTFYDDLQGDNEVAWNLCWNETMNKFVTFYSWVPSFSENIYNQYFSFDRETSKQIAKLSNGSEIHFSVSGDNKDKLQGVMYDNNNEIGTLIYDANFEGQNLTTSYTWELCNDPYGNKDYFELSPDGVLSYKGLYNDFIVPLPNQVYYGDNPVEEKNQIYYCNDSYWFTPDKSETTGWHILKYPEDAILIAKLNKKRKQDQIKLLEKEEVIKGQITKRKVYLLTVKVTPTITYSGSNASYAEYIANKEASSQLTGGSVTCTIAVIPKDHLETLSTDFWRHGQSGIIDITEDITPTKWYGKQHPFEFEFIVRDQPDAHKIFDNLILISNKAEPHSFHYEIVGECYEFAKDKKNMYIRQEATKELYQNNGYNISFNSNYKDLQEIHRPIKDTDKFDKSTIFPAYYRRQDRINTIEDYYHERPGEHGKDFDALSGSEIVYHKNLNEFRIWTHSKAVDINDFEKGRLRSNMNYKEDKWYVQIPSIHFVQCNEPDWKEGSLAVDENGKNIAFSNKIPIELGEGNFMKSDEITPEFKSKQDQRGIVIWDKDKVKYQEAKLKDKYIKIRVRYEGKNLAVISAIKTLYSISYA